MTQISALLVHTYLRQRHLSKPGKEPTQLEEELVLAQEALEQTPEYKKVQELKQGILESEIAPYKETKELLVSYGFDCYKVEIMNGMAQPEVLYFITHESLSDKLNTSWVFSSFESRFLKVLGNSLSGHVHETEHEAWVEACKHWEEESLAYSSVPRYRWRGIELVQRNLD